MERNEYKEDCGDKAPNTVRIPVETLSEEASSINKRVSQVLGYNKCVYVDEEGYACERWDDGNHCGATCSYYTPPKKLWLQSADLCIRELLPRLVVSDKFFLLEYDCLGWHVTYKGAWYHSAHLPWLLCDLTLTSEL